MKTLNINKTITNVKFSDDNKFDNLQEYILQCKKGEFELSDVRVTRALNFDKVAEYEDFTQNLLEDREELKNLGDKDEAAAVYLNNKLKFIVVT